VSGADFEANKLNHTLAKSQKGQNSQQIATSQTMYITYLLEAKKTVTTWSKGGL
jgi:hypothetical protein